MNNEIWLVKLPVEKGHEQFGTRPALVLARPIKEIAIIIPFTSNLLALRFPYTLKVEPSKTNGLKTVSILLIFQIRAIDSRRLIKKIGELENEYMQSIKEQLIRMLSL